MNKMRLLFFILFYFLLLNVSGQGYKYRYVEVYKNAKIWTGDSLMPWANTIATSHTKIIYIGNKPYKPTSSDHIKYYDLKGKLVLPGFIDNHTHFIGGGAQLNNIDLRNIKSKTAFISTIKKYTRTLKKGEWILGGNWNEENCEGELPTKEWIDSITANNPVLIWRYDGHTALANSAALAFGEIINNEKGILKDADFLALYHKIPPPDEKQLQQYILNAQEEAYKNGVTQICDMSTYGGWTDLHAYKKNYADNKANLRIYLFTPITDWKKLDSIVNKDGKGSDYLKWGGVKAFADGSLGSHTAWMKENYLDENSTGLPASDTNILKQNIIDADKAGLQVAVHAIGNRANEFVLDAFAIAKEKNKTNNRNRIEHAQHLTVASIAKFTEQNIIASMQPYHLVDDGNTADKKLIDSVLQTTYAFKDLLKSNAVLTFGSDWSVALLSPLAGIYAAVTRQTSDGKNKKGWYAQQKITVEQAVKCYTANNAFANYTETKTGMLKEAMLADFIILDKNIFTINPEKIKDVKVLKTVIGGTTMYEKK